MNRKIAVIGTLVTLILFLLLTLLARQLVPTVAPSTDEVELRDAVATYCDGLMITKDGEPVFKTWEWELGEDPNPTDSLFPGTCLAGSGESQFWVNLKTLEVIPRTP
jgi:hypothetical protein